MVPGRWAASGWTHRPPPCGTTSPARTGVERRRQDPRDLHPSGEARGLGAPPRGGRRLRPPRSRRTPPERQADEGAPSDDGRREECGVRADDRLLGRAQKESREVARRRRAGGYVPQPAGGGSPDEPPRGKSTDRRLSDPTRPSRGLLRGPPPASRPLQAPAI